ncbi:MAG: 3-isopropylmalate dehydrogenase [Candidatus Bipolaricaulota bacterium]|nr:3-isopropylmalate dehydrogenase [Candidatus Bipolaricaulota bacterium]
MNAKIVLLPGDGIGPEVVAEAVKVLRAIAGTYGHDFQFSEELIGGVAIDRTGSPLPEQTLAACRDGDAVLLGAVGGPKWSDPRVPIRPEQGLLGIREGLGLYANLRPVHVYDELVDSSSIKPETISGVDLLVVRELTGGIYFGARQESKQTAYDTMIYTEAEVRRIARVAFETAMKRRKVVASVDKANVLASSRLWRRVVEEVAAGYPEVTLEHMLVDSAAMKLIRNPAEFDVILTANMFGDILTDEASMLSGSLGMLPSASLGDGRSGMYEPVHGSAPDIAGKNLANPIGTIMSVAMLLRTSLALEEEARALEMAVENVLSHGYRTADIANPEDKHVGTTRMGDLIVEVLQGRKDEK